MKDCNRKANLWTWKKEISHHSFQSPNPHAAFEPHRCGAPGWLGHRGNGAARLASVASIYVAASNYRIRRLFRPPKLLTHNYVCMYHRWKCSTCTLHSTIQSILSSGITIPSWMLQKSNQSSTMSGYGSHSEPLRNTPQS